MKFEKTTWLKNFTIILAIISPAFSSFSLAADSPKPLIKSEVASSKVFNSVKIPIAGMSCMSCAAAIKNAVKKMDGVISVEVDLEDRAVNVSFLDTKVNPQKIAQKINELGYKAGHWEALGK